MLTYFVVGFIIGATGYIFGKTVFGQPVAEPAKADRSRGKK